VSEHCTNSDKLSKLEAVVERLAGDMTLLVASNRKTSDAMELMARTAVTTENNTRDIGVLFKRVAKTEDITHSLESAMYQSCDTKSQEITRANRRVEEKLGVEVEKMDVKGNKRLGFGLLILTFAFGYLVLDVQANNGKMDKVLELVTKTERQWQDG